MMAKIVTIRALILFSFAVTMTLSHRDIAGKSEPSPKDTPKTSKKVLTPCETYHSIAQIFLNNVIYPKPLQIIANTDSLKDILDVNARLRVTPVGEFNGYLGVVEYFYGLTIFNRISSVDATKMICEGNIVGLQANILFTYSLPGQVVYPNPYNVTLMAFLTFNENSKKVQSIEASLLNFGTALDRTNTVNPNTGINNWVETYATICGITVYGRVGTTVFQASGGTCVTGANRIWANTAGLSDYDYCMAFLSGSIVSPQDGQPLKYGSYNGLRSNTVLCRLLHSQITVFDPNTHCKHVSPAGGGACVDVSYESFYNSVY